MTASNATEKERGDDSTLYMGTSIRNFLYQWRFKALSLVKLLLMQRRILVFGYPVERLCTLQYSLVALIPTLLSSLQDAASPELQSWSHNRIKAESLKMSDRQSLLSFMGLPLSLFSKDSVFQPYCPLQQLDLMKCNSYLIGTTNRIFKQQREQKPDVIVDLQHFQLNFNDPALGNAVALTPADRSWMDQILTVIQETWNTNDPSQPALMQYEGSDDYLRARFEEYVLGFLSTAKFSEHQPARTAETPLDNSSAEAQYGAEAIRLFRGTSVFAEWDALTDGSLCDLIGCKHPCSGKVSAISDVTLRLSAGLHDLRIDESLAPTREAIGAALQAGGAGISKVASSWRSDLARFNQGWTTPKSLRSARNSTDMGKALSEDLPSTTEQPVVPPLQTTTDANSTDTDTPSTLQSTSAQGYSAVSYIGSFLSSKKRAWTAARQGRNENTQ
ncbi:hypothetical protein MYAM1_001825 [Malassezia yamatoensis]|uniref:AVL9/DENND6 domain-containing protein n=1 Tax=Malassezia yamatoensis TaxID=253288 RepID=A0AAJ6CHR7_9BASI|nr:hypothetical protein MYAM1_001825 [Malassezia yamatoensis]